MLTIKTKNLVVTRYGKLLAAGTSYKEALEQAAIELAGKPCPELLKALAVVHATKYECNLTWNERTQVAQFHTGDKSTRETKQHAAYAQWKRLVLVHFTTKRGNKKKVKPSNRVEVDRVTALARTIKAKTKGWSAKEKKALFAALI